MKIVVSVNELSAETQLVIDNMRRSKAPVLIGDANQPAAVLLSYEEYQRLQSQAQASASTPASEPARIPVQTAPPAAAAPVLPVESESTQPINPVAEQTFVAPREMAAAEAQRAEDQNDIARRTAATIQADRAVPPEQKSISQRPTTLQPDPTLAAKPVAPQPQRAARLTKPMPKGLPKPPGPLSAPRPRTNINISLPDLLANWQTIALVVGVLILGIVGFALIVNAFGG